MSLAPRFAVHRLGQVGSTMDEAARLAAAGAPDGTVVVAESQSAGRGRAGRAWTDEPGRSLLCTVLLRPAVSPARLGLLSLVAGVAAAEAIEAAAGSPVRLKWPNDLWLGDDPDHRKVGGILLQARTGPATTDHVLVGIGLNVATPAADLPPGATSILASTGRAADRDQLLATLLDRLAAGADAFVASGGHPDLGPWRARAALLGEEVAVEQAGVAVGGRFAGVDDDGALLLDTADGLRRIVAGDLVRGPTPAPRDHA